MAAAPVDLPCVIILTKEPGSKPMHYKGHVEAGVIVLDEPAELPDGTLVRVEALAPARLRELHPDIQRLAGLIPDSIHLDQARLDSAIEKHSCG